MKSVFQQSVRVELINRINSLNENNKSQWGKMNVYQMIKHCIMFEEMTLGKKKYKRAFMGRLIGKIVLKSLIKDERPMGKNAPTAADFKIVETSGDIQLEKKKWMELVKEYEHFSNDNFEHWFFGRMTKEQTGYFAYKHADHHLRQFNS